MNMPADPRNERQFEPRSPSRPFRIALLAPREEEREELCDALQVNGMGHELMVFSDADQLFEVIEAASINRSARNGGLPNLLMIAAATGTRSTTDILARIKDTATIKAIPVIVFCPRDVASSTPQLYQLGAASVIRMPLQFNGLIEIIRVMEDYWFKVASPPPI